MKITVSETRECCQERDLKPYLGDSLPAHPAIWPQRPHFRFCQHCGQLHVEETYTEASGDQDTRWRKWP